VTEAHEDKIRMLVSASIAEGREAVQSMSIWRWPLVLSGLLGFGCAIVEIAQRQWMGACAFSAWFMGTMMLCDSLTHSIRVRQARIEALAVHLTAIEVDAVRRRLG